MVTEATADITLCNKKTVFYSGQNPITFLLLKKIWNCKVSDNGNDFFNPD